MNSLRSKKGLLVLFFFTFLLIALIANIFLFNRPFHPWTDTAYYFTLARNLAAGNGYVAYNPAAMNFQETVWTITYYDPGFPFLLNIIKSFVNQHLVVITKVQNLVCWLVFFAGFMNFYRILFKDKSQYFYFASLFLLFSVGLWTYANLALAEPLFIALLALLVNSVSYSFSAKNLKKSLTWMIIAGILAACLTLTRKLGLGFILGIALTLLIFIKKFTFKQQVYKMIAFVLPFALGWSIWLLRNYLLSGHFLSEPIHDQPVDMKNFSRIIEVINYFFVDTFGIPSSMASYAFLLIIPFLFILAWIFFKIKSKKSVIYQQKHIWLFIAVIPYLGLVIYGSFSNPISRQSFQRYFYLLEPLIIPFLLLVIEDLRNNNLNNWLNKIQLVFISLFLIFVLVSGANRTRIYFSTLPQLTNQIEFFNKVSTTVNENDLILSHHWPTVTIYSAKYCKPAFSAQEITQITDNWQSPIDNTYLVLVKAIGNSYHKDLDGWEKIMVSFNVEIIKENEQNIFLKIK